MKNIEEKIFNYFEEAMIDNITYRQWISVDRYSFEIITKTPDEFVESFCEQLMILKRHAFIAQQQSKYMLISKIHTYSNLAMITHPCFI